MIGSIRSANVSSGMVCLLIATMAWSRGHGNEPDSATTPSHIHAFEDRIRPALIDACITCHGPENQEANLRVDTLDPDLIKGQDVQWWLEVFKVISNGEMPPDDGPQLDDADRQRIVQWLSSAIQSASQMRRRQQSASAFRRMTRYEINHALQDLLGLAYDFTDDLPPETASDDGFTNRAASLPMSTSQLSQIRDIGRQALMKAIVRGERPTTLYWGVSMDDAAAQMWSKSSKRPQRTVAVDEGAPADTTTVRAKLTQRTINPRQTHFRDRSTGDAVQATWRYSGARQAWPPMQTPPIMPSSPAHVAIIPAGQKLVIELGNQLPDSGTMRVRIRASRASTEDDGIASLRLHFGHQASNNSSAEQRVGGEDQAVLAPPDSPQIYQFDVPLSEVVRNPLRRSAKMGATPSPSEFVRIHNTSFSPVSLQVHQVEVIAPWIEQWPPKSHQRIFAVGPGTQDEISEARSVIAAFMRRAWRRDVTDDEVDRKVTLFDRLRPHCDSFEEAVVETLATVLSSPNFLYLTSATNGVSDNASTADHELATRLAMFLWCSLPDTELMSLASAGKLQHTDVLLQQARRMMADSRGERLASHFVRGWLGMELLDHLKVDAKTHRRFDLSLKEAMQQEPIAFFQEVLDHNDSVMDFLDADYVMVNERLAIHYGMRDVKGNHFRRVPLDPNDQRGGLLTQAGLLAMNSDGKDSHPLKRGIWLLKCLLNDPPPPPPPAVPEIDLADPRVAKMTLKERIEDHRNHAACMSCHARIDPWGIAFEEFDAVGQWRTTIGKKPVDATSVLFNGQTLDGMDGLKRFLLANRQDQFANAMVQRMATFALGRPLTFEDRAEIDRITANLQRRGDGLVDLVELIVTSSLFRSP